MLPELAAAIAGRTIAAYKTVILSPRSSGLRQTAPGFVIQTKLVSNTRCTSNFTRSPLDDTRG